MYASLDDRTEYLRHDIRFHQALDIAAKKPVLATLTDMVSAMLYYARKETIARIQSLRQSVELHRKIYRVVRLGSEDKAKAAMSEHLVSAGRDICMQDPPFYRKTEMWG